MCSPTYLNAIDSPEWQRRADTTCCSSCSAKGLLNKSEHVMDSTLFATLVPGWCSSSLKGQTGGLSGESHSSGRAQLSLGLRLHNSDINFKLQFNLFSSKNEKTLPFYDKNKRLKWKRAHLKEKGEHKGLAERLTRSGGWMGKKAQKHLDLRSIFGNSSACLFTHH